MAIGGRMPSLSGLLRRRVTHGGKSQLFKETCDLGEKVKPFATIEVASEELAVWGCVLLGSCCDVVIRVMREV